MIATPAEMRPVVPSFAIRVGVTGTLQVPPEHAARIADDIRALLTKIRSEAERLVGDPAIAGAYAPDPDGVVRPQLRIVSPLAEGADRLVARIALECGYRLEVPMPFAQGDYVRDFKAADSRADFETLLARAGDCAADGRARVLELDGGRGEDETASYGAVGRLVVRNCDLLIAVWDGHPGKGRGGTADTVHFAARSGPPVWWIHSGDATAAPSWVETATQLRRRSLPQGAAAERRLCDYLDAIARPPPPVAPVRSGVIGRICATARDPLPGFYAETRPGGRELAGWIWQTEERVMWAALQAGMRIERWLDWALPGKDDATPHAHAAAKPAEPEPAAPSAYWGRRYAVADGLATAYSKRYRSSYAIVTIGAAFALVAAGLQQVTRGHPLTLSLLEFASMALLFGFVVTNHTHHWHERWISYRLLAELCRKQAALSALGWSLPVGEIWRVTKQEAGDTEGTVSPAAARDAWVGWYFHANLRAAPLPTGSLSGSALRATSDAVAAWLLESQIDYHETRAREASAKSHGLIGWGEVFLIATALSVAVKVLLVMILPGWSERVVGWLEIAAQFLVIPSAAFLGLRIYAELEVLAEGSEAMARMMQAAKRRLHALWEGDPNLPLVSQEVGSLLYEVAIEMLAETEGWARLFNVKDVGPS